MKTKIKWRTELEIVDTETGEIIPRYMVEQGKYIIMKKEITYKITENENTGKRTGTRYIKWLAEGNKQQTLF